MGLLVAFSALFLLLMIALSFASVRLFAAKDEKGQRTAPGCLGGCLTAMVLSLVACLGLAAFVAGAWTLTAAKTAREVIEAAPDIQVGVWHDRAEHVQSVPGYPLHIVLRWSGHAEPTETLLRKLEEAGGGSEMVIDVSYDTDESGAQVTTVDIALSMSHSDAGELERMIEDLKPELKLSEGIEITFSRVEPVEVR
jgi:hypothetical protein